MKAALIAILVLITLLTGCQLVATAPADPTADNLSLTLADQPLPEEARKAQLAFAYEPQRTMRANQVVPFQLMVKNVGSALWPYSARRDGKYQIRLADRWVDGNRIITDDGRGPLPYDLRPGDEAEVLIFVTAPSAPGDYSLEFALVQEQVGWFEESGSGTLKVNITVE